MRRALPLLLLAAVTSAAEPAADLLDRLGDAAGLPAAVRKALRARLGDDAETTRSAAATADGVRYGLAVVPLTPREDPDLKAAREDAARTRARAAALHALVGRRLRERYAGDGLDFAAALARALAASGHAAWLAAGELGPGMQEQLDADAGHAAALVWLDADAVVLGDARLPGTAELKGHYLRALRRVVGEDLAGRRYEAALEKLLAMSRLGHYPVSAELDTALCFDRLNEGDDAAKLARHVWQERREELDSRGAETCGDLLQSAGDHVLAEEAYRKAIELAIGEDR